MTYNVVRISGQTKKKHLIHPGYESQTAAKTVLHDMVKAHLKQGQVLSVFELSFITEANGDVYRVEDAKYFQSEIGAAA